MQNIAPPDLPYTPNFLARLAREVACDINELVTVLGHFGLTQEQYDELAKHPLYVELLNQANLEWKSATNAAERIKLSAAVLLEEVLPKLAARMSRETENISGVSDLAKTFAKLAGIGERDGAAGNGEKFVINIDIGGGHKIEFTTGDKTLPTPETSGLVIDVPAREALMESDPVRALVEGPSRQTAIEPLAEGSRDFTEVPREP